MMNPAMSPLIRRTIIVASVLEETMGRKAGRPKGGSDCPDSMNAAGSSRMMTGSSAREPATFKV